MNASMRGAIDAVLAAAAVLDREEGGDAGALAKALGELRKARDAGPGFAVVRSDSGFGGQYYRLVELVQVAGLLYGLPVNLGGAKRDIWRRYRNKAEAFREGRKLGALRPDLFEEHFGQMVMNCVRPISAPAAEVEE